MPIIADHPVWLQFKHHRVRELAFSLASPPLIKNWPTSYSAVSPHALPIDLPDTQFWQQHFKHYLPRLQQLDQTPAPLLEHLACQKRIRLGNRFEQLLTFWLKDEHYHPYQLLGNNIQRMDGQRTVGEADFLLYNRDTCQTEHWEVTVKFYLGEKPFSPSHWVGLNRNDTLARKLQHLCQHQFNVTSIASHVIDKRRAIIKGCLFYPINQPVLADNFCLANHSNVADYLTHEHLKGFWGYILPSLTQFGLSDKYHWHYATKHEWLAQQPTMDENSFSSTPIKYFKSGMYFLLNRQNQPMLYYMLRICDKSYIHTQNTNIMKLNHYVADIFKDNSIR